MPVISRRSFVERLALGAGGMVLSPIAQTLVNEARGQVADRKIVYFFLASNGMNWKFNFTPPELRTGGSDYSAPIPAGTTAYTWPTMFKALEPYRNRALLLDGMANEHHPNMSGHSMGFSALSTLPPGNGGNPDGNGSPGGVTVDQFIAQKIGGNTPRRSVLFGVSAKPDNQFASVFASGRNQPEPHTQNPAMLFDDLFGALTPSMAGALRGGARQRILFDRLRVDLSRLQSRLTGAERAKLDQYLATMEDYEKREMTLGALACSPPPAPAGGGKQPEPEDALPSMAGMAAVALACGITNVVGVAVGCGFSHANTPTMKRLLMGTPAYGLPSEMGKPTTVFDGSIGHAPDQTQAPAMDTFWNWCSGIVADTIGTLSKIKVGDRTLWDNSLFVMMSENGEEHHAWHRRWPVALFGNAGAKLKSDGRFIRFQKYGDWSGPNPRKFGPASRTMADLFCSIATASGAPTSTFGQGGNAPVNGPIDVIMT